MERRSGYARYYKSVVPWNTHQTATYQQRYKDEYVYITYHGKVIKIKVVLFMFCVRGVPYYTPPNNTR